MQPAPRGYAGGMKTAAALVVFLSLVPGQDAAPAPPAMPVPAAPPGLIERIDAALASAGGWPARAAEIRRQILVSAGLWPPLERKPAPASVFGKVERDGFTVERVRLETWPGFHVTGNLFRPRGKVGPFPAVLSPHGHWRDGRFQHDDACSIPGRALTLARMGFVVLTYDMAGFGDLKQVPHAFLEPWSGLGLLGLQLHASFCALDFVAALPDVDPRRIGATGASGGGTQTFLLAAVDDRIACAAPVCMVAAEFQGGCACENAPGLRIGLNNVEIAAAMAPRPLLLPSATGDWTKHTLELEAPLIAKVYRALGAEEKLRAVRFEAGHNYARPTREAVYAWFARWLQGAPDRERIPEPPFDPLARADLSVAGPDFPAPGRTAGLAAEVRKALRARNDALWPTDRASFDRFREAAAEGFRLALPAADPRIEDLTWVMEINGHATFILTHRRSGDVVKYRWGGPEFTGVRRVIVVVEPTPSTPDRDLVALLPEGSKVVLEPGTPGNPPPAGGTAEQWKGFPETYRRPALGGEVQRILTALTWIASREGVKEVDLVGLDSAGLPALLAGALAPPGVRGRTIADFDGLDDADEKTWTGSNAHALIRGLGGVRAAALLAAARGPLVLHDTRGHCDVGGLRATLRAAGLDPEVTSSDEAWTSERIARALR